MKNSTLYDVKKAQNDFFVNIDKNRKKVIKSEKTDIKSKTKPLYLTSLMGLLTSMVGIGAMKLTGKDICLLVTLFGAPCCIIPLIEAQKNYTQEDIKRLKEIKTELNEINKTIKKKKISKEEVKKLKKISLRRI